MSELSQEQINKELAKLAEGLEMDKAIEAKLLARVAELLNKVQYPDNYCPKCAERMFFKNGSFCCPLHGKQDTIMTIIKTPDPQVPSEKLIPTASTEFIKRPLKTPGRAETIRKLANELPPPGTPAKSSIPVDPRDGMPLPGATSKNINWV